MLMFLFTAAGLLDVTASSADSTKGIVDIILQHGITGAMLLIVLWGYFRKDKALEEERAARIEDGRERAADAERYGQTMVALQGKVTLQADKLIELTAMLQHREQQREIVEAATGHDRDDSRRTGPQRQR